MSKGGMLMASKAKIRANNKSNKKNTKTICVRLSFNTDADILKKLDEVQSKMGYIKELIRKDLQTKKNSLFSLKTIDTYILVC